MKRKQYKASKLMISSKAMAHMRDVAYGRQTTVELHRLSVKQAARDDVAVMEAAEIKRQRKMQKRLSNVKGDL